MSNAFCEQALSQNSFSVHPALLPSPNASDKEGLGENSHSFLLESLCFALRRGSVWVTLPAPWQPVQRDTEPVSCPRRRSVSRCLLQLPRRACPFLHLTWQLCGSGCASRLLGFGCLELHRQAARAVGEHFPPCAGCGNWPQGGGGVALGQGKDLQLETAH